MAEQNFQKAEFNEAILKWAREDKNISTGEAAEVLGFSREDYERVESGEKDISIDQLRLLSQLTKRPFGFFYLPELPAIKKAEDGKKFVRVTIEVVAAFDSAKSENEIKTELSKKLLEEKTGEIFDLVVAEVCDEGNEIFGYQKRDAAS